MNKETFDLAKTLLNDIDNISNVLRKYENDNYYIKVISSGFVYLNYSERFQEELIEWLKIKKEEYQKEFYELNSTNSQNEVGDFMNSGGVSMVPYEKKIERILTNRIHAVGTEQAVQDVKNWLVCEWQCDMIEDMTELNRLKKQVEHIAYRMIKEA